MRTYKPKPKYVRGRMLRCARLRDEGMSLRQIATVVGVSRQTVLRDLRKWEAEQAQVSRLPVTEMTPGGHSRDSECDAVILPLRRSA